MAEIRRQGQHKERGQAADRARGGRGLGDAARGNDRSKRSSKLAEEVYNSITWENIPAGEFEMGDNFDEGYGDEYPVHTAYLGNDIMELETAWFDKYLKDEEQENLANELCYPI